MNKKILPEQYAIGRALYFRNAPMTSISARLGVSVDDLAELVESWESDAKAEAENSEIAKKEESRAREAGLVGAWDDYCQTYRILGDKLLNLGLIFNRSVSEKGIEEFLRICIQQNELERKAILFLNTVERDLIIASLAKSIYNAFFLIPLHWDEQDANITNEETISDSTVV